LEEIAGRKKWMKENSPKGYFDIFPEEDPDIT
jgi:hypothetical protein